MKLIVAFLLGLVCFTSHAQWNSNSPHIYYNSGNVGIGTSTPSNVQGWNTVLDVSAPIASKILSTASNQSYRVGLFTNSQWYGGGGFIGTESDHDLYFVTNYNAKMLITKTGNVGVGTTAPAWSLDVCGTFGLDGQAVFNLNSTEIEIGDIVSSDGLLDKLSFYTRDTKWMTLDENGNLSIGTTDPKGYKLAVAGKTITEEVVVKLQGNWPDYVFSSEYKLPSLLEVEQFIKANKHLPEVPSAEEVKENGLSVGEMNAILLKKVEELTLHLIEQNKTVAQMKEEHSKTSMTADRNIEDLTLQLVEMKKEIEELKQNKK